MATVTHTIYSQYDPKDREKLEQETGQNGIDGTPEVDPSEEWRRESAQTYPRSSLAAYAPRFVPATISYDEFGRDDTNGASSSRVTLEDVPPSLGKDVAGWYRSLRKSDSDLTLPTVTLSSKASTPPSDASEAAKTISSLRNDKNNWFIMNAIKSEPTSVSSTPAPTLADILSRDPPPSNAEKKFIPPVWMEIGPSNKGFAMLQRGGWNEGETLGPYAQRRKPVQHIIPSFLEEKKEQAQKASRKELVEVKMEEFDGISELKRVDVVDLTLSESDSETSSSEEDKEEDVKNSKLFKPNCIRDPGSGADDGKNAVRTTTDMSEPLPQSSQSESTPEVEFQLESELPPGVSAHGGRALLTPIATVLKADRLGIGLKAKTTTAGTPGSLYRVPQKRVTHGAAAMAAHIRAAEEARKRREDVGRGRRGFERQRKKEREERKALLAYMNT